MAALCIAAVPAQAQITRGFIGAHEYALPDPKGMKPWNVFVEYSTLQNTSKAWNASGDKTSVGKTEVLVSLSKFVHFWEVVPDVGIAMELIVPKVGIRDKAGLGANSASGIADPIVGPAFWIKPSPNWTLGTDMFFLQIPLGDSDVGAHLGALREGTHRREPGGVEQPEPALRLRFLDSTPRCKASKRGHEPLP